MSEDGFVFVTGATGFVGSHLVDHLVEKGRRVRCLVRRTSNLKYLEHPDVSFVYGGLDDGADWSSALDDVHTIYHVAGLTFARRASDYYRVNHKGTEAIVGAALKHRNHIRRFVLISSLAAVGPSRNGSPVTEETEPSPITPYGRSKLMGEEAVSMVKDLLPAAIVRPPAVYGPRDYGIYEFFKSISRGISPQIGRYEKKLSLVHARDLAEGIVLAGESEASLGRTYFISSEELYTMQEVANQLAKILGRRARSVTIPKSLAYAVALAAEGVAAILNKPPVINRDKVTDLSQRGWACSVERAVRELGYKQKVPLEKGLSETAEWYRKQGWL